MQTLQAQNLTEKMKTDLMVYNSRMAMAKIGETNNVQHRRTGRGGEGGCSPPKFWATQIFWTARENLGKASF